MAKALKKIFFPFTNSNIFFEKIELHFSGDVQTNLFGNKNNKTVLQTLNHHRYKKLEKETLSGYSDKLGEPLGCFLLSLKLENNDFYLRFLNRYGDQLYEKFLLKNYTDYLKKGVYIYMVAEKIMYVGRCKDKLRQRINAGYGSISPKNCYLDGQSTNCRMNPLISSCKEEISLWLYSLDDNDVIETVECQMIKELNPPWNIKS